MRNGNGHRGPQLYSPPSPVSFARPAPSPAPSFVPSTRVADPPDRDTAIARIRESLKRRTGKSWSVTGGRGTGWGWIKIKAPPARSTCRHRLPEGMRDLPENYQEYDSGSPGGSMCPVDRATLAKALCLENVHGQGVSIPASGAYREEYVQRAEGACPPSVVGEPYWD